MTETLFGITEDSANDIKKVAKGAGTSFFGSVTGRTIGFLSQVIIARFFGAEVFGLYILGLTVLKMTELLARLGLHNGAMRFVSIYRNDEPGKVKGVLISAFIISFGGGILVGGFVYFFAGFISESIFHKQELTDVIRTFALCAPFMATMMVVAGTSRGFHTTKYFVFTKDIIQPLANIALILLFILLGFGIYGVISSFVISHIIALSVGFYFIAKQFPGIKERTLKPVYETKGLLTYSAPLLFSGILLFLISWANTIMLGLMKTSIDVGVYRAAFQIPIFLTLILLASNSIYAPAIAEMFHQGHRERMENIFKTTTRWIFLLTLPLCLILIFSAKEVISIFGHDFVESGAPVLIVLAISQFINCLTGGVGVTLNMTGKQNLEMANSATLVSINIVLNYFLIPVYGSLGAAIATGITICTINLLRLLEVYMLYKIHPYNTGFTPGIVGGIIAIVMLLFCGGHFSIYSYFTRFMLHSLIVGVIFVTVFMVTTTSNEDRLLFNILANNFNMSLLKVCKRGKL